MLIGRLVGLTDDRGMVGRAVGRTVGRAVGRAVGRTVGRTVGRAVGRTVGRAVGRTVGRAVGRLVGDRVGIADGLRDGEAVGEIVVFPEGSLVGGFVVGVVRRKVGAEDLSFNVGRAEGLFDFSGTAVGDLVCLMG